MIAQPAISEELFNTVHVLADAALDGRLSDGQHAELDTLVCHNTQARQLYVRYLFASDSLRTWARGHFDETVKDYPPVVRTKNQVVEEEAGRF